MENQGRPAIYNTKITCPNCQSEHVLLLYPKIIDYLSNERFNIYQCNLCKIVFTFPQPIDSKKYYPKSYYGKRRSFFETITNLYRYYKIKSTGIVNGKILDLGCGNGDLLDKLRKNNWDACGTELSTDRPKKEITIWNKNIEDLRLPSNTFDIITAWHSLEHLSRPQITIQECARILKPGGWMIIAVPNFSSLQAQLTREKWLHLDVPRHLWHFTPTTIKKLLTDHNLKIKNFSTFSFEYNVFGFLQSILNWVTPKQNYLFSLITNHKKKTIFWSKNLIITIILLPILAPLSIVASCLTSLIDLDGTIEIMAQKDIKH